MEIAQAILLLLFPLPISDGEVWECIVTPSDGTDTGATSPASVVVGVDIADAVEQDGVPQREQASIQLEINLHRLSEVGIAGEETTDSSSYTQPGSIFVFFTGVTNIFSLLLSSLLNTAQAVPLQLTQQGRVLDNNSVAVTGTNDLTFRIYDPRVVKSSLVGNAHHQF